MNTKMMEKLKGQPFLKLIFVYYKLKIPDWLPYKVKSVSFSENWSSS